MSEPDHANIMGMELKAAREYVLSYVTTLKTTQLTVKRTGEEVALWESRVKLAAEKNRPDLQTAAQAKVSELQEKLTTLKNEEKQLTDDIARMRIQLKAIEHQPSYTVDAELLNAQMEQVVGENAGTEEQFRLTEADRALEELKKKLDPNYVTSWERAAAEKAAAQAAAEKAAAETAEKAAREASTATEKEAPGNPEEAPDPRERKTTAGESAATLSPDAEDNNPGENPGRE